MLAGVDVAGGYRCRGLAEKVASDVDSRRGGRRCGDVGGGGRAGALAAGRTSRPGQPAGAAGRGEQPRGRASADVSLMEAARVEGQWERRKSGCVYLVLVRWARVYM